MDYQDVMTTAAERLTKAEAEERIDRLWMEGKLSTEGRESLMNRAAELASTAPTVEERLSELEAKMDKLMELEGVTVRQVGTGVYEVVKPTGSGTSESDPIVIESWPAEVKPNTFYSVGGKIYVYMGAAGTATGIDDTWAEW